MQGSKLSSDLTSVQSYADLYEEQIKQALNHFQDDGWLEENSPLAHAYFLGSFLTQESKETAVSRGRTLQKMLFQAATMSLHHDIPEDRAEFMSLVNKERADLGIKGAAYQLLLLDLKYFRQIFPPTAFPKAKQEYDLRDFLGLGRSTLFNHLKLAREQLGKNLLQLMQPTLRLEQPPRIQGQIVGQAAHLQTAVSQLLQNKTVFISGVGGSGKTTLGASVAQRWGSANRFWYTFWPSLNDQLEPLLFSLGYFLNQQGASALWQQLVVNGGQIENINIAVAQLRTDLAALKNKPLLCFDEVDRLQLDPEMQTESSQQIVTFLERLKGLTPVLLIGQKANLMADHHLTLSELSIEESETLAKQQHLQLTPDNIKKLHRLTGGNPRLVKLSLPLLIDGNLELADLPQQASINSLFATLWRSLLPASRLLAQQLSVFRSPTPADAWQAVEDALNWLGQYGLTQTDEQGSVQLLPIFRELIRADNNKLSADEYERCHLAAAAIRSERGEYTAAVHHLIQARELELAVQLWFMFRQQEIVRGQGHIALDLLQKVPRRRLRAETQDALALSVAELCDLLGKPSEGLKALAKSNGTATIFQMIDVETLRSKFLNHLGQREAALNVIDQTLDSIEQLLSKQVHLFTRRGLIDVQQREFSSALASARRAQYEAALFYGLAQEQTGRYDEAFLAYQQAMAHAAVIEFDEGLAKANYGLARLLIRQGKEEAALDKAETAISYFEKRGEAFMVEQVRNTVIAIYFNLGRFDKVIELGEMSLTFFENAAMPFWASTTAATLSEAYFEDGQIEMAQQRAHDVLAYEEPQSIPYAYYTLGLIAKQEENFAKARQQLSLARAIAEDKKDFFLLAYAEREMGEIALKQQDIKSANAHLDYALTLFKKLSNQTELEATKRLLEQLSEPA